MSKTLVTYDPQTDREYSVDLEPEAPTFPPGTSDLSTRKDFTQAELAKALKISDRTVRSYLGKLKQVFYWCEADFTLANGRYTQFAFAELVKLQQAIAPYVPLVDDGETTMVKNTHRIPFDQYRESIWQTQQMTPAEESAAIVHVSSEAEVYAVEVLEESLDTIQEVRNTVATSYQEAIGNFRQLGRQLGSAALEALTNEFEETIGQGMKDLSQSGKVSLPKSRKKP
jgi:HTH domain